jgi:hypothetical protein
MTIVVTTAVGTDILGGVPITIANASTTLATMAMTVFATKTERFVEHQAEVATLTAAAIRYAPTLRLPQAAVKHVAVPPASPARLIAAHPAARVAVLQLQVATTTAQETKYAPTHLQARAAPIRAAELLASHALRAADLLHAAAAAQPRQAATTTAAATSTVSTLPPR